MKPHLESLEERSLLALIAIIGTGTDPVGPLAGHVLPGISMTSYSTPGDVDTSSYGHDTATASIALQWDPGATILPITVTSGPDNLASEESIAEGIDYAVDAKASVISISFASLPQSPYTVESFYMIYALKRAERQGIPVVVAAGNATSDNDTSPVYPSNDTELFRNVISVAATDNTGAIASFSNYGSKSVTIAADGVDVRATSLSGADEYISGTSFATPMVAGLIGRIRDAMPHAKIAKINRVLKDFITVTNNYTVDGGTIL